MDVQSYDICTHSAYFMTSVLRTNLTVRFGWVHKRVKYASFIQGNEALNRSPEVKHQRINSSHHLNIPGRLKLSKYPSEHLVP